MIGFGYQDVCSIGQDYCPLGLVGLNVSGYIRIDFGWVLKRAARYQLCVLQAHTHRLVIEC